MVCARSPLLPGLLRNGVYPSSSGGISSSTRRGRSVDDGRDNAASGHRATVEATSVGTRGAIMPAERPVTVGQIFILIMA